MAIKRYAPLSPSSRFSTRVRKDEITNKKPEKPLTITKRKKGGRNNNVRITIGHRGGRSKQKMRISTYKRERAE